MRVVRQQHVATSTRECRALLEVRQTRCLCAVGVSMEDREVLLGHANQSMAGYYASADVGRLLKQANVILNREETRAVLRVANSGACLWIKGPAEVPQHERRARLPLVSH